MGKSRKFRFGPFLAGHSSINARYIPNPYAEFSLNQFHEDGAMRERNGYRRVGDAPTYQGQACQAVKMFEHVSAIVDGAYYDEYLQVRRHGASGTFCKLFRRNGDDLGDDGIIGKANAVDHIDLDSASGGAYKLTFDGEELASSLGPSASAASVQAALETLSNVDTGDVTVTLTNGTTREYDVEWDGQYRGTTVPALTITSDTLTGGGGTHTVDRTVDDDDYQLADSYWDLFVYNGQAYIFNYAAGQEVPGPTSDEEPFLRYTIGDLSSLIAIKPPETALYTDFPMSVKFRRQVGSDSGSYAVHNWEGLDSGDATYDGSVTTSGDLDNTLTNSILWRQQSTNTGPGWWRLDMNGLTASGTRNWRYNDVYLFTIVIKNPSLFQFDLNSLKITLENASSVTQQLELVFDPTYVNDGSGDLLSVRVYAKFPQKLEPSDWETTRYLRFDYVVTRVSTTDTDNDVVISPWTIGGVVDWGQPPNSREESLRGLFQLGYLYYNSETGLSSGVSGYLVFRQADLLGQALPFAGQTVYMGTVPYLDIPESSEVGVDFTRIYMRRPIAQGDNTVVMSAPRLVDSVADTGSGTSHYNMRFTGAEFDAAQDYEDGDFDFQDITAAVPLFGAVLYLFRNRQYNCRWSKVGNPLKLANIDGSAVDIDDPLRPANFTLTDDGSDAPVGALSVENVTFILGQQGVHYQIGTVPAQMTYPKRLNAPGCFGRHSYCRWRDAEGRPGIAYVSRDGAQVWFIAASSVASDAANAQGYPLTNEDRDSAISHIFQRNHNKDGNVATLAYDAIRDSLWFQYSYRAMIFRRPCLVDGNRFWEHYAYGNQSDGSWLGTGYTLASFHPDRGIRVTAPTGYVDELEYDSTNYYAPIGGEDAAPTSTSTSANTLTFADDPKWPTGLGMKPDATGGGFTGGATVYCRVSDLGSYTFHTTLADAQTGASPIDITGTVTTTFRPLGRDNGNPIKADTCYWRSPVVNMMHEADALEAEIFRKRMENTPKVKLWMNRNPETTARQFAAGRRTVKQFVTTQGSEFQVTVYLESNSSPVYFLDQSLVTRGQRVWN